VFINGFFLAVLFTWQGFQDNILRVEMSKSIIVPQVVQAESSRGPKESQSIESPHVIKGSQQPRAEFPYGEIFNKDSGKLPFYLQPGFGGLDGSDHRREVRPNAAGQRLDMDNTIDRFGHQLDHKFGFFFEQMP